jgi:hypothetical protein
MSSPYSIMRYYRFWAGKKQKKYLEAPKLKMAAQFKMAAKILFTSKTYKPSFYKFFNMPNFYIKKNSQKFKMAPISNTVFFCHLFLEALAFVRNFKMQKFLPLEEQTPKKRCGQKINSNGCQIRDGDQN